MDCRRDKNGCLRVMKQHNKDIHLIRSLVDDVELREVGSNCCAYRH